MIEVKRIIPAGKAPANETSRIELLERDIYVMLAESRRDKARIKELEGQNERLQKHNNDLTRQNINYKKILDF
jgi:hypothetical protein